MLSGIIQWILISLVLIVLLHHIFFFLKDTLTIPKMKDLVNKPSEQYSEIKHILNIDETTIQNTVKNAMINNNMNTTINTTTTTNNNKVDSLEMKNELKSFFNELNAPSLNNYSTQNFSQY